MQQTKEAIILFIQRKVKESNAKGAIIGLSGGIDSSVVGVLAKEALGKNLLGVTLPCYSDKWDLKDAQFLISKFKIETKNIYLNDIFDNFIMKMHEKNIYDNPLTTSGNLKSRLRMCVLYFIANSENYIVLGTGNKTEISIGYFTKYGDGGVDCEPIGCLLKRDVVKLAYFLGIPKRIILKPPSAGLYKGQTDEKEIGITYKKLDSILSGEKEMTEKVKNMIEKSQHKKEISFPLL